jgi:hypothetical protein
VRAAPGPFRSQPYQGRFYRVILNVPNRAPEMFFIADVAVEAASKEKTENNPPPPKNS